MSIEKEAERLFNEGKNALDSGDYDKALKHLSMSLSYARNPEAYFLKAKIQMKKNDVYQAVSEAEFGITACSADDGDIKEQLVKLLDSLLAIRAERDAQRVVFTTQVAQAQEDALVCTAAREFAKKHKLHSLRIAAVYKDLSRSYLKGAPLVPKNFKWPIRSDGTKLVFLAQIDLAEVSGWECIEDSLPADGILSFFYDVEGQPWGSSLSDKDGWRVFYFPASSDLELYLDEGPDDHWSIDWLEEHSYPDSASEEFMTLADSAQEEYEAFVECAYEEGPIHRLLGHPVLIQADYRESIEIVSNQINFEKIRADREALKELNEDSKKWRLLLQLDSDDGIDWTWGDNGSLYFCIEEDALKRRDFSNVWVELQCY